MSKIEKVALVGDVFLKCSSLSQQTISKPLKPFIILIEFYMKLKLEKKTS